jgi:Uma2 family endonuclease
MAVRLARWRFTVNQYHQMGRSGILHEDDRVELIEGEIIEMVPIGIGHIGCVNRTTTLFVYRFGDATVVHVQNPIQLDRYNEPEPDVSLLRYRPDAYGGHMPVPRDVFLLLEVADSSLTFDRRVKVPLYARSGIPEVWLVELRKARLHVYRDSSPGGYRTTRTLGRGDRLAPLAFPDREIAVADVLGLV